MGNKLKFLEKLYSGNSSCQIEFGNKNIEY